MPWNRRSWAKSSMGGGGLAPLNGETYTVEEAAKILGICRALAYRRGVLPTVSVAGRRLVPKQALERMLAEIGGMPRC